MGRMFSASRKSVSTTLTKRLFSTTHVTVAGGGNGAHTCAVMSGQVDAKVHVLSTFADEAERWKNACDAAGGIHVVSKEVTVEPSTPHVISKDPEETLKGANVVLLCAPCFAHAQYFKLFEKYLEPGSTVAVLPGRAAIDLEFNSILGEKAKNINLLNFATLPWACRIKTYGEAVEILGCKDEVVVVPKGDAKSSFEVVQKLIGARPKLVPGSSNLGLSMNSPGGVVHPGIMFGHWSRWNGVPTDNPPLFYQGADDYTAGVMTKLSDEILQIRDTITSNFPGVNLEDVIHIRDWYVQSYPAADNSSLQKALVSNAAYDGLTHPTLKNEDGKFVPNYQARYLTEDLGYTLLFNKGLGLLTGVNTPMIDEVVYWAQEAMGKEYLVDNKLVGKDMGESRAPQKYGYESIEKLIAENEYDKALAL